MPALAVIADGVGRKDSLAKDNESQLSVDSNAIFYGYFNPSTDRILKMKRSTYFRQSVNYAQRMPVIRFRNLSSVKLHPPPLQLRFIDFWLGIWQGRKKCF